MGVSPVSSEFLVEYRERRPFKSGFLAPATPWAPFLFYLSSFSFP